MIEPPSRELRNRLLSNGLCSPSDLRRCRKRVRKLARDLPAFDCVWIDALQQIGKLTPFQTRILQSADPTRVAIGPCRLLDQLGSGWTAATFLARSPGSRQLCVLKQIQVPESALRTGLSRLEQLTARMTGVTIDSIVAPESVRIDDGRLVTICRHIDGENLADLQVRRGRFPASVVTAIARQLVDGLAALESRQCVHGEIRLGNIRLTAHGDAVLVDAGINPAVLPELTVNPRMPPERYDGIAPELIGTAAGVDSSSDIYALGCALWQLLAGRAPFPTGDPLAKLALHQTSRIADVREWAPDTPEELANAIHALTQPDPADRPSSFAELQQALGSPRRSERRCLTNFHAVSNARVQPRRTTLGGRRKWPMLAPVGLVLAVATWAFAGEEFGTHFAKLSDTVGDYVAQAVTKVTDGGGHRDEDGGDSESVSQSLGKPLPAPNADGVIVLKGDGPFLWNSRIQREGAIKLHGNPGRLPVVLVESGKSAMSSNLVEIANVRIRFIRNAESRDGIGIRAQILTLRNCRFGADSNDSQTRRVPTCVTWKIPETGDAVGGQLRIVDTVSRDGSDVVKSLAAPGRVTIQNCLVAEGARLLNFAQLPKNGRECQVRLNHVTLRQAASLIAVTIAKTQTRRGTITVEHTGCVFEFEPTSGALFHLAGDLQGVTRPIIRISGIGSLSRPSLVIAAGSATSTNYKPLPKSEQWVQFDGGILTSQFHFTGQDPRNLAHAAITVQGVPRRASGPPGIDVGRLMSHRPTQAN